MKIKRDILNLVDNDEEKAIIAIEGVIQQCIKNNNDGAKVDSIICSKWITMNVTQSLEDCDDALLLLVHLLYAETCSGYMQQIHGLRSSGKRNNKPVIMEIDAVVFQSLIGDKMIHTFAKTIF